MSGTEEGAGHHTRRFPAEGDFVDRLEGAERRRLIPQDDIIRMLGLSRRDTLVDLGAGIGYFSIPASKRAGTVVAIDMEQKMFGPLKQRIASGKISNIEPVMADITAVPIAAGSVSRILAAFVYHEVDNPETLIQECSRVLSPRGQLMIVDFQKRETPIGPPIEERKTPEEVLREASCDFELVRRLETEVYYALRFRKR